MRSKYVDNLKGIGILLVVIGHCIQYGNGLYYMANNLFFDNKLFKLIYTFHMPLFMLISGYLFYYSLLKHSTKVIFKNKVSRLILPIFFWTIGGGILFSIFKHQELNIINLLSEFFYNFNFLWALFYSSIIVLVVNKVYDDKLWVYLIILFFTFFINNSSLYFAFYLLPYFILGYYFNKYFDKIKKYLKKTNLVILFFVLLFLFLILFKYFDYNSYIYTSSYYIGENIFNLFNNMYRFIIGLVGSIIIMLFFKSINKILDYIKIFTILGKNSLAIYIISFYFNSLFLMENITANFNFNYINVLIETIIIIFLSTIIAFCLRKNKYTKKYLLGE